MWLETQLLIIMSHFKELEILGKFLLVQMQLFFTIQNIMFK